MKKLFLLIALSLAVTISYAQTILKVGQVDTASAGVNGLVTKDRLATNLTGYQKSITLTVTGASGAATFSGGTLNIPTYTIAGLGGVPTSTTVNGKALSSNITLSLASSDFVNQGTTITVLHGNAAGNLSWGAVNLASDVSGLLPDGNISSATNWNSAYTNRITSLTTTGTTGAATLSGNTLNIPNYTGLQSTNFVYSETPSGSVNGSNTSFTIANTPTSGTVLLYKNGQRLALTTDYTISSATITMNTAPLTGDILLADYRK